MEAEIQYRKDKVGTATWSLIVNAFLIDETSSGLRAALLIEIAEAINGDNHEG